MSKAKAQEAINPYIATGESLIGIFSGTVPFKFWLCFLIGPLAAFSAKGYFIAITDKGLHFVKIGMTGKPVQHDFFAYSEIKEMKLGKGILQMPMTFYFTSGKKFFVKGQRKGVERVAKLDDAMLAYLKEKIQITK